MYILVTKIWHRIYCATLCCVILCKWAIGFSGRFLKIYLESKYPLYVNRSEPDLPATQAYKPSQNILRYTSSISAQPYVIKFAVHSTLKHLEGQDSEHPVCCVERTSASGVSWGLPQARSPAGLHGDGTETEQCSEICSLRNALTGDDAMVAKVGLQIVVSWLVFLSPASMERVWIPLSHWKAVTCNEIKSLKHA